MKYEYVESYGSIWKLSQRQYRKLTAAIQEGKNVNLDDYGKIVIATFASLHDLQDGIIGRIEL